MCFVLRNRFIWLVYRYMSKFINHNQTFIPYVDIPISSRDLHLRQNWLFWSKITPFKGKFSELLPQCVSLSRYCRRSANKKGTSSPAEVCQDKNNHQVQWLTQTDYHNCVGNTTSHAHSLHQPQLRSSGQPATQVPLENGR